MGPKFSSAVFPDLSKSPYAKKLNAYVGGNQL